jgi:protein-S-isoprenylcysteine O-methyltransferase Ste14
MKRLQNKIPPPVITLIIALAMWGLDFYCPIYVISDKYSWILGFLFISTGLFLDIVSFLGFTKNKTTVNPLRPDKSSSLVVDGFYRYTRNPMYLGMLLVLCGIAFLFGSVLVFIMLPIFIVIINELQIKPEENALTKIFDVSYLDYKKKVRRWL